LLLVVLYPLAESYVEEIGRDLRIGLAYKEVESEKTLA
jgi:hypothetical protein